MISSQARRSFWRRHLFILAPLMLLACAALLVYARGSKNSAGPYALASDLPRGALLYAQFSDLPALVKRWNSSTLKERYLASTNFEQFQSRHLALKLMERWEEFNSALGFPLDALTLGESAENRAALAVYDIGRLEMVFVAPVSEEKLKMVKFFQNAEQFEETELPGGSVYYSRDVEAEGGRREQKFAFASAHGLLVLATSEPLLLRTLANINGLSKRDRLSDDPSFKKLSAEVAPHFLTLWMDQSKLNTDWYFKHYWIMRNVDELKNISAAMLDLEIQDGRWIEHRDFLLSGQTKAKSEAIPPTVARRIFSYFPEDAPYIKLRTLSETGAGPSIVRDTFLDRLPEDDVKNAGGPVWRWQSYDDSDFYPDGGGDHWHDYYYLDPNFDSLIDDPVDAKVEDEDELAHAPARREAERRFEEALRDTIAAARPLYAAQVESPQAENGPLFVEFRRGALLTLQSPTDFRSSDFESAVKGLAESRLMIAGASTNLAWTDASCGAEQRCRELRLPMLGWGMYYALKGPDLILASSAEMLEAMLKGEGAAASALNADPSFTAQELTVIRLNQREQSFDSLMKKLDAPLVKAYWEERQRRKGEGDAIGPSQEFFSGNIASLLDVASPVSELRIKRNLQPARLREEVEIIFK